MRTTVRAINILLLLGVAGLAFRWDTPAARGRGPSRDRGALFVRGDANDDGRVDIADVVFALEHLFSGGTEPPCPAAADANDDGRVEITDAIIILEFLFLGASPPAPPQAEAGRDPTPDLGCRGPPLDPLPAVGSPGGPDRALSEAESLSWRLGLVVFDRFAGVEDGLGPRFNGDSCRGCHLFPVVGGAGDLDVDVVRFAYVDGTGTVSPLDGGPAVSRLSIHGVPREEQHPEANVIETRQTPSALGLGLVDRIADEVILANEDPDDADGDGVSGRALRVGDRIGRFGHKAGVPSLADFAADALFNELGLTVSGSLSDFAVPSDTDAVADPELSDDEFGDLVFFLSHLAPPARRLPEEPALRQRVAEGEALFAAIGCARCHVPELAGADGPVRAYSDFLLHEVADPGRRFVDEAGVDPREYRTAPLWGIRDTAPYLHDGAAETIRAAILGHHGEALAARRAFEALSGDEQLKLEEFLSSL